MRWFEKTALFVSVRRRLSGLGVIRVGVGGLGVTGIWVAVDGDGISGVGGLGVKGIGVAGDGVPGAGVGGLSVTGIGVAGDGVSQEGPVTGVMQVQPPLVVHLPAPLHMVFAQLKAALYVAFITGPSVSFR